MEQKQGVSSKLHPCKDTFSHIFSDSPSCKEHYTPELHFLFSVLKHLWCYFFVIDFCGWNQLFESVKVTTWYSILCQPVSNILPAVLMWYFLQDCIDFFYEITRTVNHPRILHQNALKTLLWGFSRKSYKETCQPSYLQLFVLLSKRMIQNYIKYLYI